MSRRPYVLLPLLIAVHTAVWSAGLAMAPFALPLRHVVAEMLSTFAVVTMSANAVISTRPHLLDRWFGGLDKLFVAHRLDGIAVATAVAGHFALMPESPGWVAPKLIAYPNIVLVLVSIGLAIAPRSPWRKLVTLRYNHWHLEHRFMGVFLGAALAHSLLAHPIAYTLAPVRIWVLGAMTIGLTAYVFRETIETRLRQRFRYTVASATPTGAGVLEVSLEPAAQPVLRHVAGQFAFVRFDDGPSHEAHPFTISRAPAEGRIRFSIKASGDFTEALQTHLAAETPARLEGPYGRFDHRTGTRRQLWLAGGVGITPYLAFLGEETLGGIEVRLIWSVREPAEATYADEIEVAAARLGNVRFDVHPTRTAGHLDLGALELGDVGDLSVFICGPVPLRDAFLTQLKTLGVPRRRIFYEEFSLR